MFYLFETGKRLAHFKEQRTRECSMKDAGDAHEEVAQHTERSMSLLKLEES